MATGAIKIIKLSVVISAVLLPLNSASANNAPITSVNSVSIDSSTDNTSTNTAVINSATLLPSQQKLSEATSTQATNTETTHSVAINSHVINDGAINNSTINKDKMIVTAVADIKPVSAQESAAKIKSELPLTIKPVYSELLSVLYADNQMQLLWQDENARNLFQDQLALMAMASVNPQFSQWLQQLATPELSPMAKDIILSDAMFGYLYYLDNVTKNGERWLYNSAPFKMQKPNVSSVKGWQNALTQGQLVQFVTSLAPQNPRYEPMRKELLKQLADTQPWPQMQDNKTLRAGENTSDALALREILVRLKLLGDEQLVSESPTYDPLLVEAVKNFQTLHGLENDGVIGKKTREWLNMTPQMRAAIMALNIQRLRIVPAEQPTAILVNIPDYSLYFYVDNELILESKTIVGRPDRKTPIMSSALNNVVINPPWNVPTSMVRKDIVPHGKQDPSYFSRRGYTILSGWSNEAAVIDPYSIDWSAVSAANFPYRIRQAPGPSNSLGRYKFNMPSSDAIYLHDTPNHSLFKKEMRAISSGCVRVNKASELASILLGDAGWNSQRVSGALKEGNTRFVNIPQRIPVFLYYQTAWADEGKTAEYRADIYGYDADAIKNIDQFASISSYLINQ